MIRRTVRIKVIFLFNNYVVSYRKKSNYNCNGGFDALPKDIYLN